MNIQIFGRGKCFDTKKAQRYFKERGVKFQYIDLKEKEMSRGEFKSVCQAVGGYASLVDERARDQDTLTLLRYLAEEDREEKLFGNQQLIRTPVVRNGKCATVGYCPEIWKEWK